MIVERGWTNACPDTLLMVFFFPARWTAEDFAGAADRKSSMPDRGSDWTREAFSRSNKPFSVLGDILLIIGAIGGAECEGDGGRSGKSRIIGNGFVLSINSGCKARPRVPFGRRLDGEVRPVVTDANGGLIQSDGSAAAVADRVSGPDGELVSRAVAKWTPIEPAVTRDDTGIVF
jgi:hypothetical protein